MFLSTKQQGTGAMIIASQITSLKSKIIKRQHPTAPLAFTVI